MNKKTIRTPKGPAVIFLTQSIDYFFIIFSSSFLAQFSDEIQRKSTWEIIHYLIFGAITLFMSIVLFSKKYDNLLLISTAALLIPGIFNLFSNLSPYLILEIIFYIVLFAFTYIMVKMPETPIRKAAVKLRFIIPLFQFLLLLFSTIQMIQGLYENVVETTGTHFNASMNLAAVVLPAIMSSVSGFLPLLCYILLVNWLANPYEE